MFFTVSLYIALTLFLIGLIYKVSGWFRYQLAFPTQKFSALERFFRAIKGMFLTFFSKKIFIILKVFFLEIILQKKVLQEDFLRWFMHICIYYGFMLLLVMHAFDEFITASIFSDYFSTINPFLFLRDLFGALVVLGLAIAVYRRFILKVSRPPSNVRDIYAMIIVAFIIISGIVLEGVKITSYSIYQQMEEKWRKRKLAGQVQERLLG